MPMIMLRARLSETRALRRHAVSIVKTGQPIAIGIVQRERIAQSVRPFRRRLRPPGLEFQPITLLEVMNAAIEPQQKVECLFVGNSRLSSASHVMIS
jgi:hypothetical protein